MNLIGVFVVAAVVLLAVLVGAAVPSLLQLRSTLRSLERFLETTRPKLHSALDQVTEATGRVNRAAAGIEEGMTTVRGALEKAAALGEVLDTTRESVRRISAVAAAIAPALAAGFRAFWREGGEEPAAPAAADPPGATHPEADDGGGGREETS